MSKRFSYFPFSARVCVCVCLTSFSSLLGCARASILLFTSLCWHYIFIWSSSITELSFRFSITSKRFASDHKSNAFWNPFCRVFLSEWLFKGICVYCTVSKNQMSNKSDSYFEIALQHRNELFNERMDFGGANGAPAERIFFLKNKRQKFFFK